MLNTKRWPGIALVASFSLPTLFLPILPPAQPATLPFDTESALIITLDSATPVQSFAFHCTRDKVASVTVETISGDLAVAASLLDPIGSPFAHGVQVSSNPNVTIAEAVILPASGDCLLKISRSGTTSGSAQVRLLSGYARLARWDNFDEAASPLRMIWTDYGDLDIDARVLDDERLRLQVYYDNTLAFILPDDPDLSLTDVYVQADFEIEDSPSYFEYGFLIRSTYNADAFYTVTFSDDGDYSIYYFDRTWTTVQEWTISPLIDGSDHHPRVGVWVQDNVFRLYYGDQLVGEVIDTARHASQGNVGIATATTAHQTGTLTVYADNVLITTPFQGQ